MAATNYTPISIYYSATASATPSAANLVAGELALNTNDGKLFYKDSAGVVQVLASKAGNVNVSSFSAGSTGFTPNTATTGAVTLGGTLNVSSGGTGASTLTGYVYGNGTGAMTASTTIPTSSLSGTINLSTQVTGTLAVSNGGTGLTTLTAGYIPYGNGTSAFSSSSNLFWDSVNSRLGIGTNTTNSVITAKNPNVAADVSVYTIQGATSTSQLASWNINQATDVVTIGTDYVGSFAFKVNSSEKARITNAGYLGIGTSSPNRPLTVNGTGVFGGVFGTSASVLIGNNGSVGYVQSVDAAGSSNYPLAFFGASEYARFDTSGNLGLGVTPSAWGTAFGTKVIDISSVGSFVGSNTDTIVVNNSYFSGGWYYKTTNYASYYDQASGKHQWFTAPSGTAGNAITFTQAMTLDNSGNLLVGTTTAREKITVSGSIAASGQFIPFSGSTTLGYIGNDSSISGGSGSNIGLRSESAMLFATNGSTERMRIDTSGNLLVGATSVTSSAKVLISASANTYNNLVIQDTGTTGGSYIVFTNSAGSVAGSISHATSTTVLYNTTSDYRLKTVVGSVTDASQRIDALEPIEYDWNNGGGRTRGFLAHKFAEVYPNSVSGEKDAIDEDGNPKYQTMQAATSEVMADLIAELQSLRKRVAQLEAKGA